MPLISSPLAYPPISSPPVLEKRKRALQSGSLFESKRRLLNVEEGLPKDKPIFRTPFTDSAKVAAEDKKNQFRGPSTSKGPFADDDSDEGSEGDERPADTFEAVLASSEPTSTENTPRISVEPDRSSKYTPRIKTSSGKTFGTGPKKFHDPISYGQLIASRSATATGKAIKSFYGVDIHSLIDQAAKESKSVKDKPASGDHEVPHASIEAQRPSKGSKNGRTMLWTEKYRARKFIDLVGDERTHRDVLRWIKGWDPIVFPGMDKPRPKSKFVENDVEPRQHRKILLLSGPPGLGKTTLAHVCARQAGYEVVEINASDERSSGVVKGRIRDCVGTENVRGINTKEAGATTRKAGRPVCVVVDEVDGVVSGSSGGSEGGFTKALIDLATLDQKNSNALGSTSGNSAKAKEKGDKFRLLRPMILICNDVYHPALRPLRASTMAEIIHIRKPPLDKVVARLKTVFDREGVACDNDGVRRLCEATWGISNRREARKSSSGAGEGDMRGILVVGEWAAAKMQASAHKSPRLTKKWVEENMIENLSHGGGGSRGLGRGGAKETVERVFLDGAGFPKTISALPVEDVSKTSDGHSVGVSELAKRTARDRLRELVDMSGESDRIMNDCFAAYPTHSWQDDTLLSKPNAAYEWLHFHDRLSSKVHVGQDWELAPYLSQSIIGFHHLFASPAKQSWVTDQNRWDDNEEEPLPFSGPRADYTASEALKQNKAILLGLQTSLSIPLLRSFRSAEDMSVDLLPHLIKMLTPEVKPIVVGGSGNQTGVASVRKEGEREMIQRAVEAMGAVGVTYERVRVESGQSGISTFAYRMEPPLDDLAVFETAAQSSPAAPARYAIRQALDQEYQKYLVKQNAASRLARYKAGRKPGDDAEPSNDDKENATAGTDFTNLAKLVAPKRDFFGRMISEARPQSKDGIEMSERAGQQKLDGEREDRKVWVSFHEGFSNAVRKPITLEDLMRGF